MLLLYTIIAVSVFSAAIPVLIGARVRGLLWYYAVLTLAADVIGVSCMILKKPGYLAVNLFFLGEWLLISLYLIEACLAQQHRKPALAGVGAAALFFVLHTAMTSPAATNLIGTAPLYVLFILGAIFGFYRVLQEIEVLQIERSPLFAFCAGLLIYASGSLTILLMKQYLDRTDHLLSQYMWIAHDVLNVIKNAAVAYSLSLQKKKAL